MNQTIEHNKPFISNDAIALVNDTINSGWINYGDISKKTENKLSNMIYKKTDCMTLTTNGTSALFLAMKALDIKKDDEIIVPSYTCTALLNAIFLIKAKPVVCDVSRENLSFTRKKVQPYITHNTKAIIVVHTFGIPCEIDEIKKLNIPVIEDCSQSLGSKFQDGTYTGSKGDISVFSFYASKLITGGIGGAIGSRDKEIVQFIKDYIDFDSPKVYKERFNFQISDINASLILSGIGDLTQILKRKKSIAKRYIDIVSSKYNLIEGVNHYRFLIEFETLDELYGCKIFLYKRGIKTIVPIENFELLHKYLKLDKKNFKNTEYVSTRLLSIPIYPKLAEGEVHIIKEALSDYFSTPTSL